MWNISSLNVYFALVKEINFWFNFLTIKNISCLRINKHQSHKQKTRKLFWNSCKNHYTGKSNSELRVFCHMIHDASQIIHCIACIRQADLCRRLLLYSCDGSKTCIGLMHQKNKNKNKKKTTRYLCLENVSNYVMSHHMFCDPSLMEVEHN